MFPGNKKPISELLANPTFEQDVIHEYEEADSNGENQKHKLIIPYSTVTADGQALRTSKVIKRALETERKEKGVKAEFSDSVKKTLQVRIMWQREVVDQASLHEGV